jgi:hypothetical protein
VESIRSACASEIDVSPLTSKFIALILRLTAKEFSMRRVLLRCLLLVSLAAISQAQDFPKLANNQAIQNFLASNPSNDSDLGNLHLSNPGKMAASSPNNSDFTHLPLRNSPVPDSFDTSRLRIRRFDRMQTFDPETGQKFCAYIRAYQVRREYKGSDVVTPSGYVTCLPSSRFEVRSAVITQTEPSLDK